MPKKTYTQINSVTLAAASSSVTFGSIPQNFRDLFIVYSFQGTGTISLLGRFNSDASVNYPQQWMQNSSNNSRGLYVGDRTGIEAGFSNVGSVTIDMQIQVLDYSATDKDKVSLLRARSTNPDEVIFRGIRWGNTSPVTSFSLVASSSNIAAGSTFSIYGIEA